ncbi:hypothetical protein AVEN_149112-1 [Araneus ventricosus]|uniref:Uncharacterized protein n=1 Tax=Araneus ventricosus TaxID=182803 RepID=A0A4Y2WF00_ARAVE|nr:hypothetical protein AVEN_149112-1 [Araneus ventricosus]
MSEEDFFRVCSKIDEEKEFLNSVSQKIWNNPELAYKEEQAHETLTSALSRCGFNVQKQYLLPTALKAEYTSKTGNFYKYTSRIPGAARSFSGQNLVGDKNVNNIL